MVKCQIKLNWIVLFRIWFLNLNFRFGCCQVNCWEQLLVLWWLPMHCNKTKRIETKRNDNFHFFFHHFICFFSSHQNVPTDGTTNGKNTECQLEFGNWKLQFGVWCFVLFLFEFHVAFDFRFVFNFNFNFNWLTMIDDWRWFQLK